MHGLGKKRITRSHYSWKYGLRVSNCKRGLGTTEWNISKLPKGIVEKEHVEMLFDELAFKLRTMIDAAPIGTCARVLADRTDVVLPAANAAVRGT